MQFLTKAFLAVQLAAVCLAEDSVFKHNPNTVNGEHAGLAITAWGSDFYFAICAVMTTAALTIVGLSMMKPRTDRIFFYLCAAICMTAAVAYFSMGSNLGWTPIRVEWIRRNIGGLDGVEREIFYVRYIDWFVTTPLLLLDLMLTAGLPWPTILWTIFLDFGMVITGLVGALVKSSYKWGYFTFGCVFMFGVFYNLAVVGRASARALGDDVHRVFFNCGVLTLAMWTLYPIAWGLCEGGNVITPNDEAVFYGCLDMIAKPVFSAALLYGHWNIDPARLGLAIGGANVNEKPTNGHSNGHSNGHTNGHTNGYTNGHTNGHSNGVNGTNGVTNGDHV